MKSFITPITVAVLVYVGYHQLIFPAGNSKDKPKTLPQKEGEILTLLFENHGKNHTSHRIM